MAKHPNKSHDDTEDFDSNKHREANRVAIEKENEQVEMVAKETAENQELANFKGFPVAGETRDQLLARIRKQREEVNITEGMADVPVFRSEGLQKEFEAEQKAGQEAVAKAQAIRDQLQAAGEKNQPG